MKPNLWSKFQWNVPVTKVYLNPPLHFFWASPIHSVLGQISHSTVMQSESLPPVSASNFHTFPLCLFYFHWLVAPSGPGFNKQITWGSTDKGSIHILIFAPPLLFLFSLWLKLTFKHCIVWVFPRGCHSKVRLGLHVLMGMSWNIDCWPVWRHLRQWALE